VLKDEEAASKQMIEAAFSAAGFKVPALAEVLAGLKIDQARAKKLVTLLLRTKFSSRSRTISYFIEMLWMNCGRWCVPEDSSFHD